MRFFYRPRGGPWGLSLPWWAMVPVLYVWLLVVAVISSWALIKAAAWLVKLLALLLFAGSCFALAWGLSMRQRWIDKRAGL